MLATAVAMACAGLVGPVATGPQVVAFERAAGPEQSLVTPVVNVPAGSKSGITAVWSFRTPASGATPAPASVPRLGPGEAVRTSSGAILLPRGRAGQRGDGDPVTVVGAAYAAANAIISSRAGSAAGYGLFGSPIVARSEQLRRAGVPGFSYTIIGQRGPLTTIGQRNPFIPIGSPAIPLDGVNPVVIDLSQPAAGTKPDPRPDNPSVEDVSPKHLPAIGR